MTYTVLARKYRPETFQEVVGQEWISRALANAIRKGRVAHAFLFSGPRGVGKTSMARILAKALNCKEGPTPEPCLACPHCIGIARGADVDVLEIDAASNRGIDHIRMLRENVRYAPVSARFKIFVIDEVHMLTTESFNALLKTLEEPPPHVKFVFATTEPLKMPETVRSRCQWYEFRRIPRVEIVERLRLIAEKESIPFETGVLQRIALLSRGGLRDAESLLDQVVSLGDGKADFEALNALTGRLAPQEVGDLVDAILEEDTAAVLEITGRAFTAGTQGGDLLKDLLDYWRALMATAAGALEEGARLLPGMEERLKEQAGRTDLDRILAAMQIALEALRRGRWFEDERLLTEMAILKTARLSHTLELSEILRKLGSGRGLGPVGGRGSPGASGRGRGGDRSTRTGGGQRSKGAASGRSSSRDGDPPPAVGPPEARSGDEAARFGCVVREVEKGSKTLASYLRRLPVRCPGPDAFELLLPHGSSGGLFDLEKPEVRKRLEEAARKALGRPVDISFARQAGAPGRGPGAGSGLPSIVERARDLLEGDVL